MSISARSSKANPTQVSSMQDYYKWHAKLYQATRWTFLFGRKRLVQQLSRLGLSGKNLLEVGCGTGQNLSWLANKNPDLSIIGLDVSKEMLQVAHQRLQSYESRLQFMQQSYEPGPWTLPKSPDIILFSYCLTMINPGWEAALERASKDLAPGGLIAVLDFQQSRFGFFRRWMGFNHVRMDDHLRPLLREKYTPIHEESRSAYGGLWTYFIFIGRV